MYMPNGSYSRGGYIEGEEEGVCKATLKGRRRGWVLCSDCRGMLRAVNENFVSDKRKCVPSCAPNKAKVVSTVLTY